MLNVISRVMCLITGHQPNNYEYAENASGSVTTTYTECARCNARKNIRGVGWIPARRAKEE